MKINTVNIVVQNKNKITNIHSFTNDYMGMCGAFECFCDLVSKINPMVKGEDIDINQGYWDQSKDIRVSLVMQQQSQSRIIHQFIKNKKGQKVGVWAGIGTCGKGFTIGWSLANTKHGDKFDKETGIALATERAMFRGDQKLPQSLWNGFDQFEDRCIRYFKV